MGITLAVLAELRATDRKEVSDMSAPLTSKTGLMAVIWSWLCHHDEWEIEDDDGPEFSLIVCCGCGATRLLVKP